MYYTTIMVKDDDTNEIKNLAKELLKETNLIKDINEGTRFKRDLRRMRSHYLLTDKFNEVVFITPHMIIHINRTVVIERSEFTKYIINIDTFIRKILGEFNIANIS